MLLEEEPPARRHPRLPVLLAVAVAVLLHALLVAAAGGGVDARPIAAPVSVRTVAAPGRVDVPVEAPPPAPRLRPIAKAPRPMADIPATSIKPVAGPPVPTATSDDIPVYRTAFAPAAVLAYELKRGMLVGTGELSWSPQDARYGLRLEGRVAGVHVLTEESTGGIDRHGLAPLRYTDWRARRATQAANFQRDKGKITWSGPTTEAPLPAGAQDRLSWMLQIGAVLNAEPQHAVPGGRIVFFVSGAQGDADTWTFRYAGTEDVPGPSGVIRAVKFTREPRQTYDRLVEVWLAPAHRHLPVRARITATANGEAFELLLRGMRTP
ncbi:MAG TPA: DUF3108 domain-containing protein [Albitalea sp.]|uniref:DUF3108 domain-containing protein n=1 Tax=Piscinibacter sp. TaxID=1903157 RepID=UPI002ED430DE